MVDERTKRYLAKKRAERIDAGESTKRAFINELREPGPRAMVIAIVDQAMSDYWALVRSGSIVDGKPGVWASKRTDRRKRDYCGMYEDDVGSLIRFFESDCSKLLKIADIHIDPDVIQAALKRLETTGDWAALYGVGKSAWKLEQNEGNNDEQAGG